MFMLLYVFVCLLLLLFIFFSICSIIAVKPILLSILFNSVLVCSKHGLEIKKIMNIIKTDLIIIVLLRRGKKEDSDTQPASSTLRSSAQLLYRDDFYRNIL